METLTPRESEVQVDTGEYYLRRTLPYRTQDDRIDGVVITFTDVSELRRASEGLRKLAAVLRLSGDAIVVHGLDGGITSWNQGATALYGHAEDEALRLHVSALLPDEQAREEHAHLVMRLLAGETVRAHETRRRTKDGRVRTWTSSTVTTWC